MFVLERRRMRKKRKEMIVFGKIKIEENRINQVDRSVEEKKIQRKVLSVL
jgi:hypothetical protein